MKKIYKSPIFLVSLGMLLTGCGGNNEDDLGNIKPPSSIETGWLASTKNEVMNRVNSARNVVESSSYRLFNKKMTFASNYERREEVTNMDNPKEKLVSTTRYISTYTYNPDNTSFKYTYDTFYVEEDEHLITTINITLGVKNGKVIVQCQERRTQYEEYDIDEIEVKSGETPKSVLEDTIQDYLFYMGLNLNYYFNQIEESDIPEEQYENMITRKNDFDVKYFTKKSDGFRITSKQDMEEYSHKQGTTSFKYESFYTSSSDSIVIDNVINKAESKSESIWKDYDKREIEKTATSSSLVMSETSKLEKIQLL